VSVSSVEISDEADVEIDTLPVIVAAAMAVEEAAPVTATVAVPVGVADALLPGRDAVGADETDVCAVAVGAAVPVVHAVAVAVPDGAGALLAVPVDEGDPSAVGEPHSVDDADAAAESVAESDAAGVGERVADADEDKHGEAVDESVGDLVFVTVTVPVGAAVAVDNDKFVAVKRGDAETAGVAVTQLFVVAVPASDADA
jgi:hypothetical protein